jgi:cellobiose-specific phosphotransferase system component IIA
VQNRHAGAERAEARAQAIEKARHVEHAQVAALRDEALRELGAAHRRHHDIAQEEVDRCRVALGDLERVRRVLGFEHVVPV